MPIKELRRRARAGRDKRASSIYKLAAFGQSAEIILWLVGALSAAAAILVIKDLSPWLVALVVLLMSFLALNRWFKSPPDGWLWTYVSFFTPLFTGLTSLLQPLLKWPANWLKK